MLSRVLCWINLVLICRHCELLVGQSLFLSAIPQVPSYMWLSHGQCVSQACVFGSFGPPTSEIRPIWNACLREKTRKKTNWDHTFSATRARNAIKTKEHDFVGKSVSACNKHITQSTLVKKNIAGWSDIEDVAAISSDKLCYLLLQTTVHLKFQKRPPIFQSWLIHCTWWSYQLDVKYWRKEGLQKSENDMYSHSDCAISSDKLCYLLF